GAQEPRARTEPEAREDAQAGREGQSDGRQGTEEEVTRGFASRQRQGDGHAAAPETCVALAVVLGRRGDLRSRPCCVQSDLLGGQQRGAHLVRGVSRVAVLSW